jgi:hypothetical protein
MVSPSITPCSDWHKDLNIASYLINRLHPKLLLAISVAFGTWLKANYQVVM